jgi:fatty-acid desaturase
MNFNLYLFRSTAENSQRVILTQVIFGVLSTIYFLLTQQYIYFLYAIILYFTIGEFLQNVALHRYFAHNSFTTNKFWHSFMAIFSPLACAGSPLAYSLAHRTHHLYSDTEKDPSYTKMGFLKVAFFRWNLEHVPSNVLRSLQRDKWVMFSHNYYVLILIVFWLIFISCLLFSKYRKSF